MNLGRFHSSAACLSPWCVKHDECVLVTRKLAVERLVGELQDILLVGEHAEQEQRQNCQALSEHPRGSQSLTYQTTVYLVLTVDRRRIRGCSTIYGSHRYDARSVVACRLAGHLPHLHASTRNEVDACRPLYILSISCSCKSKTLNFLLEICGLNIFGRIYLKECQL